MKMKQSDRPIVIRELMVKQNGLCPICGKDLTRTPSKNIVIDHDHQTGYVRAAVHRGCNGVEGKIKAYGIRWGKAKSIDGLARLFQRLVDYWTLHQEPQTDWIYYKHKTAAEKRAAYNAKRRRARANAKK